ncbi:hypothetical protein Bcell_1647 [Evansella cellulosilytica DSM 2522]|uniref:Uncharacterized protein n=1 Tax=Evansella cellulosilytica (strain ATCC 21833 / DSM 2522 / FERM P-1141 / JCM 9156 / N-4) TaxID=649639 RepID=E6TWW0_EVAC2|nr:hypothetical protein Bcell_1647 [Evansella cellulosilytica DSM 2522]
MKLEGISDNVKIESYSFFHCWKGDNIFWVLLRVFKRLLMNHIYIYFKEEIKNGFYITRTTIRS